MIDKKKALLQLARDGGYGTDFEQMIQDSMFGNCPGICLNCGYTIYNIEPDSRDGWCEDCRGNHIISAQELMFEVLP